MERLNKKLRKEVGLNPDTWYKAIKDGFRCRECGGLISHTPDCKTVADRKGDK